VNVEELVRNRFLEDANTVFLKGAKGELRATDKIYDLLIEEDCRAGDHSNALIIAYEMRLKGRMATTFHFNCLLSVKVQDDACRPNLLIATDILSSCILIFFWKYKCGIAINRYGCQYYFTNMEV